MATRRTSSMHLIAQFGTLFLLLMLFVSMLLVLFAL